MRSDASPMMGAMKKAHDADNSICNGVCALRPSARKPHAAGMRPVISDEVSIEITGVLQALPDLPRALLPGVFGANIVERGTEIEPEQ